MKPLFIKINRVRNSWFGNFLFIIAAAISYGTTIHKDNLVYELKTVIFRRFQYDLNYLILLLLVIFLFIAVIYGILLILTAMIFLVPENFRFNLFFEALELKDDLEMESVTMADPKNIFAGMEGTYGMPLFWRIIISGIGLVLMGFGAWFLWNFPLGRESSIEVIVTLAVAMASITVGLIWIGEAARYSLLVEHNRLGFRRIFSYRSVPVEDIIKVEVYKHIISKTVITSKGERVTLYNFPNSKAVLDSLMEVLSQRRVRVR